ncbi:MAG: hypothetical protein AB7V62_06165 [Thermoleophilia bacterium]
MTPRRRAILAWVAFGLAILILVVSSLTVWVKRQALDADAWADASVQILENDDVRAVLSERIVDSVFQGNVAASLQEDLPPVLAGAVPTLSGLLRQAAVDGTDRLLQTPQAANLWREANRVANTQLVALLEGDEEGALQSTGGDVVLDLQPLIDRVSQRLGVTPDIPEDAGQIVILHSDELGAAQDAFDVLNRTSMLLVLLVIALLAVAVWLAEGFRRRMLLAAGVAFIASGLVLLVARHLVGGALVAALTEPTGEDAGWATWLIGTSLLRDIAVALILYGALALVGALLAGPYRWAATVRRWSRPVATRPAILYGVLALIVLIVLLNGPSTGRQLLGVVILLALLAAGVEALRRQILREPASAA